MEPQTMVVNPMLGPSSPGISQAFFFALGKLPLPTCLSEPGCVVYVMPDNASVQATAKLDVQDEDAEKAAATALQSLGLCCAEIQFEISGQHIQLCWLLPLLLGDHSTTFISDMLNLT